MLACQKMNHLTIISLTSQERQNKEKLDIVEVNEDACLLAHDCWSVDKALWPSVELPDICTYLINLLSPYTKESLKA